MTASGTGARGKRCAPANSSTSTADDSSTVGPWISSSPRRNDSSWATTVSPSTGTPVVLPSWLVIISTPTPAR